MQVGSRSPAVLLTAAVLALAALGAAAAPTSVGDATFPPDPGRRLALGQSHTCAILTGGVVRCWGANEVGQLGRGDTETIGDDELPADVPAVDLGPGLRARAIAAGDFHTCVIATDDSVRCWGENRFGQLGYGNSEVLGDDESAAAAGPVDLGPGRHAVAIAAASNSTCAMLDDTTLRCWGGNSSGQLGLGSTRTVGDDELPASVPVVDLGSGRRAVAIAAGGFHTCAVLDDGRLRCWGGNGTGELGTGTTLSVGNADAPGAHPPVNLGRDRVVRGVGAGLSTTCALLSDGVVRCWGYGAQGAHGLGFAENIGDDEVPATVPAVQLGVGRRAVALALGSYHSCALLDGGEVRCWGSNGRGQLGLGERVRVGDAATPDLVPPVDLGGRVVEVAAGGYHTCARLAGGELRCWGANNFGQLGLGTTDNLGDLTPLRSVGPIRLR